MYRRISFGIDEISLGLEIVNMIYTDANQEKMKKMSDTMLTTAYRDFISSFMKSEYEAEKPRWQVALGEIPVLWQSRKQQIFDLAGWWNRKSRLLKIEVAI